MQTTSVRFVVQGQGLSAYVFALRTAALFLRNELKIPCLRKNKHKALLLRNQTGWWLGSFMDNDRFAALLALA